MATKRLYLLPLSLLALIGCTDSGTEPSHDPQPIDISSYLTPEVAATLQSDGLFQPVKAPSHSPEGTPLIDPQRAKDLATVYVSEVGPNLLVAWEDARGGRIVLDELRSDDRVFFADTPFGALPEGVPTSLVKAYGPYYLLPFVDNLDRQVLSIAVSAYNTDIDIVDGGLKFPVRRGNDFVPAVLPANTGRAWPVLPEKAAEHVAKQFSMARISSVPRLVLPPRPFAPQLAHWEMNLSSSQEVAVTNSNSRRGTARVAATSTFGNPARPEFLVRSATQPRFITTGYIDVSGETLSTRVIRRVRLDVPIRPGEAVAFDTIAQGAER